MKLEAFLLVSLSYRNTPESFVGLQDAVETVTRRSCSDST